MKLSKEIRIAIVSIITIVAFILGANFLKGRNFFKPEKTLYVYYDDANNLIASSSVFFKGMKVGRVDKLEFVGTLNPRIRATIIINERLDIPRNSIARIATADLLGTKIVELILSSETEFLKDGDTLIGEVEVDMITEITTQLMPMKDKIESLATSLDVFVTAMDATFNEQAQRQIQSSIRDLSVSLNNAKNLTSSANKLLDDQRENVDKILKNFAKISEDLNKVEFSNTVTSLQSTLAQTEELIKKLNSGEGTAGQLLHDQRLYDELTNSATNLNKLLEDLNANPKRYVHFSLFGRKSK
ncbi:MAG: MlaD family protein [Bacteroidales bacterium]|jgi:phospholipid/cholesterol/gamma-HCH transport system substrate-binding protein|nr:MlaD family protein [Bacteroidales bacterium]